MKAKEYFAKYDELIIKKIRAGENADRNICDLFFDMARECQDVMKSRKVRTDAGVVGTIREFNEKWNAVAALFEKKYQVTPIKYNGFKNYWINEIPEMAFYAKQL